ncbi:MAG: type II toxin-antitoxin system HipA family toxin [Prosthecobacter sp.]|uniref:type II toxin-antitoxin system HipA family toxin n=1 Tax=Prosthecobacter sp. TaxID=1965333 RepID=UPI0038FF463A
MSFPPDLCLSTLRSTRGQPYSAAAIRSLWGGIRVAPMLPFEQKVFAEFRREAAPRISISGVQDKISLRLVDGRLTPTDTDGQFILKPVPRALAGTLDLVADVPANEHVTMQIASQVFGLRTAACGLVFFPDGEPAYIVRRFDRDAATGRKLAQEDFCQLAGKSRATHGENYKYDGSHEELGRLLRRYCPAWKIESERLFALIACNYLCGNGDAHLKNFSLLETPFGDSALSPAYDLLCTSLHLPTESRTALDFFADFTTPSFEANGFAKRAEFVELASRFGIQESRAEAILKRLVTERAAVENLITRSFLSHEAKARYQTIVSDRLVALEG